MLRFSRQQEWYEVWQISVDKLINILRCKINCGLRNLIKSCLEKKY